MRLAVVSLLIATASFAQADRPAPPARPPVQTLTFTEAEVSGGIVKPMNEFQVIPERPRFRGLIQLRGSFARELARSVDAVP
ncbi:MAG: hypothetical protein JNJ54_27045 [Myxococcaceae bacterium]|nr:hypothetical protein [Myxococcaceae bacterium]